MPANRGSPTVLKVKSKLKTGGRKHTLPEAGDRYTSEMIKSQDSGVRTMTKVRKQRVEAVKAIVKKHKEIIQDLPI